MQRSPKRDRGWSILLQSVTGASCSGILLLASCDKSAAPPTPDDVPPETTTEEASINWPVTRGAPSLQGYVDTKAPTAPRIEWTFELQSPSQSEAAVLDDTLVVGDLMGTVYALSLKDQKPLWTFETEDTIEAAPTIHDGRVFIGSSDQQFYALDLATGEKQWSIEGNEKFSSSANLLETAEGIRLLVNGYDGTTRCLNPEDGTEVWTYETQDYINGTPAIINGRHVAFGGCDSVLHVLDASTGTSAGQILTDAQITNSVATYGDMIYAGNYANQVVAAQVGSKELKWIYEGEDFPFFTAPAVDDQHVYIGCRDKSLHAIDRETGKQVWTFPTGGRVESSPIAFQDAIVFGSSDGRLYAADPATGKELWQLDLGEKLTASPVFAQDRLIIAGGGGTVFVIQ
ncbi:PQQ-binding-like beta-propeller repeat protein [Haloferula rosea]|uniref:PQQ-like beta-propeller repeat protein n=1 Tax=Haloferula rosea TaxID=490093 RepID=A0A934RCK0_9BACT|nr:PQQ-binding-like beta-propeller repeat protein [Haloferula rosea]MBK1826794.1 PQQ-like beta-propeller repeat protein [Haloferula rosea]